MGTVKRNLGIWLLAFLALSLTGLQQEALADEVTIKHRGINAVPLVRKPPRYPAGAARDSEEGWVLVSFVVEHTGYPPEIVELDADLEADLGIDSIKKAQMFGEIGEQFVVVPGSRYIGLRAPEIYVSDDATFAARMLTRRSARGFPARSVKEPAV